MEGGGVGEYGVIGVGEGGGVIIWVIGIVVGSRINGEREFEVGEVKLGWKEVERKEVWVKGVREGIGWLGVWDGVKEGGELKVGELIEVMKESGNEELYKL